MVKVSVVVPCLNMSRYIDSCLSSILNQTLKELEILVVDGGSTDGTLDILEGFMKADKRVKILHSEKKSYGYQVNMGITGASGQYIAIVDADDRIVCNMYETLYNYAVVSEADYVKGSAEGFYTVSDDLTYYMPLPQFPKSEYKNGVVHVAPMERPDLLAKDIYLWYGIFKREFMKSILLHESPGAAFQDLGGLLQTQMKARKAVYLEDAFYQYRQDNAASSVHNARGFQLVWEEYTWAEQFICEASSEWKSAFYRKLFLHTSGTYHIMAIDGIAKESNGEYAERIREKLRSKLVEGVIKREDFSEYEWEDLRLLLESGSRLYDRHLKRYLCQKRQLTDIMEMAADKKIIVFGYGNVGMFVYAQIRKHGLGRVVAFCDNQTEKHGLTYGGVLVLSPEEAARRYPDACYVITSTRYLEDMKRQLAAMKISQRRVCAYTAGMDMYLFGASVK